MNTFSDPDKHIDQYKEAKRSKVRLWVTEIYPEPDKGVPESSCISWLRGFLVHLQKGILLEHVATWACLVKTHAEIPAVFWEDSADACTGGRTRGTLFRQNGLRTPFRQLLFGMTQHAYPNLPTQVFVGMAYLRSACTILTHTSFACAEAPQHKTSSTRILNEYNTKNNSAHGAWLFLRAP